MRSPVRVRETLNRLGANPGDAISPARRTIATNKREKDYHWPHFAEESGRRCRACDRPIKLKHIERAARSSHQPPRHCYTCLAKKRGKKTARERKVELAIIRAREREKNLAP